MGEAECKPPDEGEPPMAGAGGWEIFRFKAISAGKITLQLVYRGYWEEAVEPVNTFSLGCGNTIILKQNNKKVEFDDWKRH
jgi:predicted secreted protein